MTYPDGEMVNYTYDPAGRLQSVSGYVESLDHDAAGNLTATRLANGTEESFTHDPKRDWLTDASVQSSGGTSLYQAHYTHAAQRARHFHLLSHQQYELPVHLRRPQPSDEVTRGGDMQQSFGYDSIGNMTHNSKLGNYTYSDSQPHAVVQAGIQQYAYDANGNTRLRDGKQMVWNPENQPEWIEGQQNGWTHSLYDSSGQRVFESVSNKGPNAKAPPAAPTGVAPSPQQVGGGTQAAFGDRRRCQGISPEEHKSPLRKLFQTPTACPAQQPTPIWSPQGQSTAPIGGAGQPAMSTAKGVERVGTSPVQSGGQVGQGVGQSSGNVGQGTPDQAAQQSGGQQPSR